MRGVERGQIFTQDSSKASVFDVSHPPAGDSSIVAPVAYQVILEPGIGRNRGFESPRVHTRINSWGLFLAHKMTCGKRESVS